MAQYYNVVTNPNGTFTIEDLQQICSIDGQSVQFVVEDINNGASVISQPILAYATSDNSEQTLFSQSTINIGDHVSTTQLEQRPSVYIIKSTDASTQNIYTKVDSVNSKFESDNDTKVSKDQSNVCYTQSEPDWLSSRENNESFELVIKKEPVPVKNFTISTTRNQQQFTTAQVPTNVVVQNRADQKTTRLVSVNKRNSTGSSPIGILRANLQNPNTQVGKVGKMKRNSALANNPNVTLTTRSRASSVGVSTNQLVTPPRVPQPRPPIHPDVSQRSPLPVTKNVPSLQYPEMGHLSERIRQATLKQRQINNEQRQMQKSQQPVMAVTSMTRSIQPTQSPAQRQRTMGQLLTLNRQQQQLQLQQQQLQQQILRQQTAAAAQAPQQSRQIQTSTITNNVEPMEVDSSENVAQLERLNQANCASKSDGEENSSESYAYLQQEIDDPHTAIVQQQITGNEAKMLVILENGEQRLITFEVPKEDCTVQDLLEQANILTSQEPHVSLVSDPALGINYIVDLTPRVVAQEEKQQAESSPSESTNVVTTSEPKTPVKSNNSNAIMSPQSTISPRSFYKKTESNMQQKSEREILSKRGRGRGRGVNRAKQVKEPECLTISSDEEDDNRRKRLGDVKEHTSESIFGSEDSEAILEKEPVITNNPLLPVTAQHIANSQNLTSEGKEQSTFTDAATGHLSTYLTCRTVRIGSYKYIPNDRILISSTGLKLEVPLLEDDKSFITVDIKLENLIKVLIHFSKSMPVLFFYTNVATGLMIRDLLGMQDPKGPYFDPAGRDNTHKRITLLPDKIMDDSKTILKELYKPIFEELNSKEANDILVKASPKTKVQVPTATKKSALVSSNSASNGVIQTITVYPPPPAKGGIAINTEDFICLAEDQFLNDVIIDFYLKYLTLEVLSPTDHNRTHVFSSYFYKRLTSPHTQSVESTENLSPAAKRHVRVQKWTKNVNIFEKDFIVIPINEHAHWFLAIICFPGLVGTVSPTNEIKTEDQKVPDKRKKDSKVNSVTIGNTTITPVSTITLDTNDDGSERDEAEGDDEEMESDSDDEDESESKTSTEKVENINCQTAENQEVIKVPSILIFDSLAGASRARVVATLRDYLTCEYQAKVGAEKVFSRDTIKGACPKVPQQSNFTDCGLYVLQYVESFFQNPVMDYTLPIKTLKTWFEEIVVTRKREEIANLLTELVNNTKGNKTINLPTLTFPTQDGKLKQKSESQLETRLPKLEPENKKKTTEAGDSKLNATVSTTENVDNSSELVTNSEPSQVTVSQSSSQTSSTTETNLLVQKETTPLTTTKSCTDTMAFLKNKRIPRLQKSSDNQEDKQVAKKHKGDSFDSCK